MVGSNSQSNPGTVYQLSDIVIVSQIFVTYFYILKYCDFKRNLLFDTLFCSHKTIKFRPNVTETYVQ